MAFLPLHQTAALQHPPFLNSFAYSHHNHNHTHRLSLNSPISTSTTTTAIQQPLLSLPAPAPTAPVAVLPTLPPSLMDAGPLSNHTSGASPTNSNTSAMSATVVNAPQSAPKKKQGRGPGKKDIKDKPTVSVRWDDGDLTDRLITAIESSERWQGVFAPSNNEPGQVRSSAPVAKRDLQREIARHLFHSDPRYDLDDRKVLESLAVSVKNKLFKITTLYAECKQDLGQLSTLKDERELAPGSDAFNTWSRVKEKFPQFIRIRDLMSRLPIPGTPHLEDPLSPTIDPTGATHALHSSVPPRMSTMPPNNSSSSLKGAVDTSSYIDTGYVPAGLSAGTMTSPTFPVPGSYGRRLTSSSSAAGSSRPGTGIPGMTSTLHQTHYVQSPTMPSSSVHTVRPAPYPRPQLVTGGGDVTSLERNSRSPEMAAVATAREASPPLSQTIQAIVATLSEKKDREQARAHELEVLRVKRDEAERVRWHQREMMRLKIKLIREERQAAAAAAAAANPAPAAMASSTPGAGPGTGGAVEDDLALAAGLGDDQSMEGDGEGELDEEMFDPEPRGYVRTGSHHGGAQ